MLDPFVLFGKVISIVLYQSWILLIDLIQLEKEFENTILCQFVLDLYAQRGLM